MKALVEKLIECNIVTKQHLSVYEKPQGRRRVELTVTEKWNKVCNLSGHRRPKYLPKPERVKIHIVVALDAASKLS